MPVIATAAWSIPKTVAARFPTEGSGLERYAAVFKGVEINSTFYRRHKPATFARWAASVPEDFRFAVKLPREITHTLALKQVDAAFFTFLGDIEPLEDKLGPLLCQLPPSLEFDATDAQAAFGSMRAAHTGPIVVEVRHKSWRKDEATELLRRHGIDRVLADPAVVWQREDFAEPPKYVRLHGTPRIYYSSYTEQEVSSFFDLLAEDSWCVFDNTASGAAAENALTMIDGADYGKTRAA